MLAASAGLSRAVVSGTMTCCSTFGSRPPTSIHAISRQRTRRIFVSMLGAASAGTVNSTGPLRTSPAPIGPGPLSWISWRESSWLPHVRLEERELFEDVQRVVPPEELDALGRGPR